MPDLISVIIPAYNAEKTIAACLDSVLQQSYTNLEVIVIDDGSTDKTAALAAEYAQKDARIKLVQQENAGQSSARNAGLRQMHGDCFTYVDSDDLIAPLMLEKLMDNKKRFASDISMCALVRKTAKGERVEYALKEYVSEGQENIIRDFLSEKYIFGPVAKLFSNKFKTVTFTEGVIFEDIEMLSRAYLLCQRVSVCDYPGYLYIVREDSTTQSTFSEKKLDLLKVAVMIQERMEASGIPCEKEMQAFLLNCYLNILLMTAESKMTKQYKSICMKLSDWIRKNKTAIMQNDTISRRKKVYARVFSGGNPLWIWLLITVRRWLA